MHEVTVQNIQSAIITLPNRPPAMLASQAAVLYEVETKRVNEAVSRNQERFPDDFVFQLTTDEVALLKSQLANDEFWSQTATKIYGGDDKRPWMFTRNGMNQLSGVLKSDIAVERSIQIMRVFSRMEEMASGSNQAIEAKMVNLLEETNALQRELITHLRRQLGDAESKIVRRRNFTPDEDAQVIKLHRQGMTPNEIGKAIGRKKGSVRSCLGRLKRAGIYSWETN